MSTNASQERPHKLFVHRREPHLRRPIYALGLASLWVCVSGFGREASHQVTASSDAAPPFPGLIATAQLNGIPLEPIEAPSQLTRLAPGDSFTGLVTLREKGHHVDQWLVYLQVTSGDPVEKPAKPAPMSLWTSLGNKLEFASTPVPATVRTLGPFVEPNLGRKPPKMSDKHASFSVDEGFLRLGLDRAAAALFEFSKAKVEPFNIGGAPFSEKDVRQSRKKAEAIHVTTEQERAVAGLVPALLSYVTIVQHAKGLEDLLLRVVERPSLWSIIREGGVRADLTMDPENIVPADPSEWGLPAQAQAYDFPMSLNINRRQALDITLVVTAPRPPLLTCGGIIGMLVRRPGDPETRLTFRVLSAHCAASSP